MCFFHHFYKLILLQNYCQSLERSLADLRQQFRDQTAEFNAVKIELARLKYYRDENQHLTDHLQKQQTDVEEVTKVSPLSLYCFIIHQIFLLACDWSKHVTWPNIPQLKLGNIWEYFHISKLRALQLDLKDNKHNSLHLGWKYAWYLSLDIICSS